jgi:hypothetical protein
MVIGDQNACSWSLFSHAGPPEIRSLAVLLSGSSS